MFSENISIEESARRYIDKLKEIEPGIETDLIEKAYKFSWKAHKDQLRKSGEPFLAHPVAVSFILAEQKMDATTLAAALLHDVLEDTDVTYEELKDEFGEEVAKLVDGVTKIDELHIKSPYLRQAETYRKMLLSMAEDLRVIIIKFADRLHNLRTLKYLAPDKIKKIAQETLDIYAPLAHRFGMAKIKWELEDLAFKHLYPEEYEDLVSKVVASRYEREKIIENFSIPLKNRLKQEGIDATVIGRPKHFYSIYRKMIQRGKAFDEIFDLLALRIITKSVKDCYIALGIVHSMWKPIPERFKDYISIPKSNGYQSIHTTVMGTDGNIIEVQIRTWEMNLVAEDGIAAHWRYKQDKENVIDLLDDRRITWLKNLIEWQEEFKDSTEFYDFFKVDLYHAEIFVFTPKGDLITLPKGATVLDFAFAVHTDLGLHCIGAKVDGKIEPPNKELKSGSTVEILHLSTKNPTPNWLRDVKTPKARSAIKKWLNETGKKESINLGKELLRKNGLLEFTENEDDNIVRALGLSSLEQLYEYLGKGKIPVKRIFKYYYETTKNSNKIHIDLSKIKSIFSKNYLEIGSENSLLIRYATCCNPVPGDEIIGFLTRGRGIVVHRKNCENTVYFKEDVERAIDVRWKVEDDNKQFSVTIKIIAADRKGLLRDIADVLYRTGCEIITGNINTEGSKVENVFNILIKDKKQLKKILRGLMNIKGIEKVVRTKDSMTIY